MTTTATISVAAIRTAIGLAARRSCKGCGGTVRVEPNEAGEYRIHVEHQATCPIARHLRRLRERNGGLP